MFEMGKAKPRTGAMAKTGAISRAGLEIKTQKIGSKELLLLVRAFGETLASLLLLILRNRGFQRRLQ